MWKEISPGFPDLLSRHGDQNAEFLVLVGDAGSTKDSWPRWPRPWPPAT
jgi:hypothetical protein